MKPALGGANELRESGGWEGAALTGGRKGLRGVVVGVAKGLLGFEFGVDGEGGKSPRSGLELRAVEPPKIFGPLGVNEVESAPSPLLLVLVLSGLKGTREALVALSPLAALLNGLRAGESESGPG